MSLVADGRLQLTRILPRRTGERTCFVEDSWQAEESVRGSCGGWCGCRCCRLARLRPGSACMLCLHCADPLQPTGSVLPSHSCSAYDAVTSSSRETWDQAKAKARDNWESTKDKTGEAS